MSSSAARPPAGQGRRLWNERGPAGPRLLPRLPSVPRSIQVQTIAACNRKCPACPYSAGFRSTGDKLPMELFDRLIAEAAQYPEFQMVALELQNEPLLDKRLPDFVARVKRAREDLGVVLVTNGTRVTPDGARALQRAGLDKVMVSLNAVDEASYEGSFGTGGYAEVVDKIDVLRDTGLSVDVSYLITAERAPDVFTFLKRWEHRGMHARLWLAHDRCAFLGAGAFVPIPRPTSCPRIYNSCAITATGDVLPCCNDWSRVRVLGNIREQSLASIWNGPAYQTFRRDFERDPGASEPCRSCSEAIDQSHTLRLLHRLIASGAGAFEWTPGIAQDGAPQGRAYRASPDYVPMIRRGRYFFQPIAGAGQGFVLDEDVAALAVCAFEMVLHTGRFCPQRFDACVGHLGARYTAAEIIELLAEAGLVQPVAQDLGAASAV